MRYWKWPSRNRGFTRFTSIYPLIAWWIFPSFFVCFQAGYPVCFPDEKFIPSRQKRTGDQHGKGLDRQVSLGDDLQQQLEVWLLELTDTMVDPSFWGSIMFNRDLRWDWWDHHFDNFDMEIYGHIPRHMFYTWLFTLYVSFRKNASSIWSWIHKLI